MCFRAQALTHPVYTGHICSETYGINWLKAQDEPLISLEVFDNRQQRRAGTIKAPKRENIGDHFALRGIVTCACRDVPLPSSFVRGKPGKRYPYYLCQTRTCDHYGKSDARDKVEGDAGEIIESIEPDQSFIAMMTAMFRHIWETSRLQTNEALRSGQRKLVAINKEIDKLLGLIMVSNNTTVIRKYEAKIEQHEHDKARLAEKLTKQHEPKGSFADPLEPAVQFLANPWTLWETSGPMQAHLRRSVLKLPFKDRLRYRRNQGRGIPKYFLYSIS